MNKVPFDTNSKILSEIKSRIFPNLYSLFAKMLILHLIAGTFVVSICTQNGVKFFNLPLNLMHHMMFWGMNVCNFLCGTLFTGLSTFLIFFFFSKDEIRYIIHRKSLVSAFFCLTSIGFLGVMDREFFFNFSFAWMLGTFIGASIILLLKKGIYSSRLLQNQG